MRTACGALLRYMGPSRWPPPWHRLPPPPGLRDRPGPPLTVSAAAVARATKCSSVTSVTRPVRAPVLLVPGTGASSDDNYSWNYEKAFDAQHIPWCAITFADNGNDDIQVNVEYVVAAVS